MIINRHPVLPPNNQISWAPVLLPIYINWQFIGYWTLRLHSYCVIIRNAYCCKSWLIKTAVIIYRFSVYESLTWSKLNWALNFYCTMFCMSIIWYLFNLRQIKRLYRLYTGPFLSWKCYGYERVFLCKPRERILNAIVYHDIVIIQINFLWLYLTLGT